MSGRAAPGAPTDVMTPFFPAAAAAKALHLRPGLPGHLSTEPGPQSGECVAEELRHGRVGQVEHLGDLGQAQPLGIEKHQHEPLVPRELIDNKALQLIELLAFERFGQETHVH